METRGLFVTGTGTDVGKTYASAFTLHLLKCLGKRGFYYKPIQCGAGFMDGKTYPGGDAEVMRTVFQIPDAVCDHLLSAPLSPHRAFHLEGKSFQTEQIQARLQASRKEFQFVLVEGAGGIRVPLSDTWEMSDLVKLVAYPALVVAKPGLGTLNHTLLTLEHLKLRQIPVAGFVFSCENAVHAEGDLAVQDNAQTIEKRSGSKFLGFVPHWTGSWPQVSNHPLLDYLKSLY